MPLNQHIHGFMQTQSSRSAQKIAVARAMRTMRVARGLTQRALAERAGLSLGMVRRFEQQGDIGLDGLLGLASALDALDGFERLFGTGADHVRNAPKQPRSRVRGRGGG